MSKQGHLRLSGWKLSIHLIPCLCNRTTLYRCFTTPGWRGKCHTFMWFDKHQHPCFTALDPLVTIQWLGNHEPWRQWLSSDLFISLHNGVEPQLPLYRYYTAPYGREQCRSKLQFELCPCTGVWPHLRVTRCRTWEKRRQAIQHHHLVIRWYSKISMVQGEIAFTLIPVLYHTWNEPKCPVL